MSLFPHQKLDWNLARLEKHLDEHPSDLAARLEFAAACLSRAAFHKGGEPWFEKALSQARQTFGGLQSDPRAPAALVIAGACLIGLDRLEPARKHLEEAARLDSSRADIHYVLGLWHQSARRARPGGQPPEAVDAHQAVLEVETACRLAPDAWEPHALLATLLWERAADLGGRRGSAPSGDTGPKRAPRMLERSQYHTVRALELGPASDHQAGLLFHLAVTCLHSYDRASEQARASDRGGPTTESGRDGVAVDKLEAANKLFTRLIDDEVWRDRAQYYLGLVNYQFGRYKNAILYLRQHLDHNPDRGTTDRAKVLARIGMAYLHLGEVVKAREVCNKALAIEPTDVGARWTLGCALAEEGREEEAIRAFKDILEDAPDHTPAFAELVRLRKERNDTTWLKSALRAEVRGFDRLPVTIDVEGGAIHPRATTRERIATIVTALREVDEEGAVAATLDVMDLTTDESLRFELWEAVLEHVSTLRARRIIEGLAEPGRLFSARAGREILALARSIPEPLLTRALQIDEEDLRRAAVDRHDPARDVADHRRAVDTERREARAWQALLLLAIASHGNRASRNLLVRWASEADADLADAARAALVMLGDEDSAFVLAKRARARGAGNLVEAMVAQVGSPTASPGTVRPLGEGEDRTCTTCQRRPSEVAHMMVGNDTAICNLCLAEIALHRRELETDDPDRVCALSGRGTFETAAMYVYRDTAICREVVDHGLGLLEREAVDRYVSSV